MPSRRKKIVRIPQLDLTVSLSREVTPHELLVVLAELRADLQAVRESGERPAGTGD